MINVRVYWKVFNPFYLWVRHKEMKVQDNRHRLVAEYISSCGGFVLDVGGAERANIGLYVPNYTVTVNKRAEVKPDLVWDGCDLPFKDGSFPYVVCVAVIHQVRDKFGFFCELMRVASERVIIYDCVSRTLMVRSARRSRARHDT